MVSFTSVTLAAILVGVVSASDGASKFAYDPTSDVGPANWASVDVPDNACGGQAQSGIDVPVGPCTETNADYTFDSGTCTTADLIYSINDHAVKAEYPNATICTPPKMKIAGINEEFEALQFHIHLGSDHALGGTYFGADFHLVHKQITGAADRYAVLGLFLEPTSETDNHLFAGLIDGWTAVESKTATACADGVTAIEATNTSESATTQGFHHRRTQGTFDVYGLVPKDASMYFYQGSLTTPPCLEVVNWNVVDKPVRLSVSEFAKVTNFVLDYVAADTCTVGATIAAPSGFTSRPVQPLNGRTVTHKCPTGTEKRFTTPAATNTGASGAGSAMTMGGVATVAAIAASALVL